MAEIKFSKEIQGSDGSVHIDATVTVTDLTGAKVSQLFARISTHPVFAKDFCSVLATFMMDSRYMPEVPQAMTSNIAEAKQLAEAIGELYATCYAQHTDTLRQMVANDAPVAYRTA